MSDFAKPFIRQAPNEIILRIGTNNVHSDEFRELSDKIVSLAGKIEHDLPSTSIGISGILNRKDDESLNENIKQVTKTLRGFCNSNGWKFISNQNIGPDCLNQGGIHLNRKGIFKLASIFKDMINGD